MEPWESVLAGLWAKSPRAGASRGEALVAHTAAVVSRLETLHEIFPNLRERVGEPRLWHRAFWACVLHDLGKVAPGFQAQLRPGGRRWGQRHEVLSLAFLEWVLPNRGHQDRPWIAAGVASHHRDLADILQLYPPPDEPDDDAAAQLTDSVSDEVVEALAAWLARAPSVWFERGRLPGVESVVSIPRDPATDFRLHARSRIHNALREYRRWVRDLEAQSASSQDNLSALALRGLVILADHTASAHVKPGQSLLPSVQEAETLLGFGSEQPLFAHQRAASSTMGSALLTAPTGSGKTEAALLWACCQSSIRPGRLYYLLPYQASLNAMYDRLLAHFPGSVALQHSRALQALYRSLLEKGYVPEKAESVARRERALARLHQRPIRVLTPYQLLRGAFRLKGYEALVTDAVEGLFIADEVHAYEARRLGMILGMMEYLGRHLGARFLVMSATFPSVLREALGGALENVTSVQADRGLYAQFARHRVRVVSASLTDPEVLDEIVRRAASGESVLVVANTVARAALVRSELAARLDGGGVVVELIHGRFNARDRFRKEQALQRRMGTRSRDRSASPIVLVATQVVEVSLNIDFDTLFTEPAPLEALVQRFGRVNRARRFPSCEVHVLTAPLDGQGVYQPQFVGAAVQTLRAHDGQMLDESRVGPWLDDIYAEQGSSWSQEVAEAKEEFEKSCLETLRAFQSDSSLSDRFDEMFDGTEVLPRGFLEEWRGLVSDDPLQASELLVPISSRQLWRLRRQGRVLKEGREEPFVVDAPYGTESGLELG